MDPITQVISVPPILPAEAVVIANASFTHTLAVVEREIAHLSITDATTAQTAADLTTRLTKAGAALELARKTVKAPFLAKCDEIDEAARKPKERIEAAKASLRRSLTAWDDEQRRIAREAEAARLAELARLEKLRLTEEAEAKRKADEIARQTAEETARRAAANQPPPSEAMDFSEEEVPKTETEKAIEAVKFAPAPVVARPSGVAFKVTLVPTVTDLKALPDIFVIKTANLGAIKQTFCVGWKDGEPLPECAGVTFTVSRVPVSTGR